MMSGLIKSIFDYILNLKQKWMLAFLNFILDSTQSQMLV